MAVSKKAKSSYDSEETPCHTVHWSVLLLIQIISPFLIGSIILMENLPGDINFKPFAPSKKKRDHGYPKTKKLNFWQILKGRNVEIHKTYHTMLSAFLRYLQEKLTFAVKPCREVGKTVWKRRSKLAENLKIFYLNILNFWRIRLIPVSVRITNL